MNVLALDISSTKPGWAFYLNGNLKRFDTLFIEKRFQDFGNTYPMNYMLFVEHVADRLYNEVIRSCYMEAKGDLHIVIEEVTSGKGNTSQRKLEWTHYAVNKLLTGMKVWYVRTGSWRSVAGVKANDEEKALNEKIKAYKKKTGASTAKLDLDGSGVAKVIGALGPKHYALRVVKEKFGIALSRSEDDKAEAICLGWAFLKGVTLCDGGLKNLKKSKKAR